MKDSNFIIITLLLLIVCYLGNKTILKRSNELLLLDSIEVYKSKFDSVKKAYFELELEAIKLSDICDEYKSSREAKEKYYLNK